MRALKDRRSMRETIIAALVEFGRGEDIGREQSTERSGLREQANDHCEGAPGGDLRQNEHRRSTR
jgi:hypothetical protein